jgi:hypothetical protein
MMGSRTSSTSVRPHACVVAFVSLLAACPGDDDTRDGGGATASTTEAEPDPTTTNDDSEPERSTDDESTGEPPPEACACVTMGESWPGVGLTCDFDEECEPVVVGCPDADLKNCAFDDLTVTTPQALACHAQRLAAHEPGMHRWELPYVLDPGVMGQRQWVLTFGDGHAITVHEAWDDESYIVGDAKLVTLRSASHFESCLEESSDEAIFACTFDLAETEQAVCLTGWMLPPD